MSARTAGLIPAHAGKTSGTYQASFSAGAHPRSRGENRVGNRRHQRLRGSSPLTRGKRSAAINTDCKEGLIPAHAGKTTRIPAHAAKGAAHPRSRGENQELIKATGAVVGSSPLTRGKRTQAGRTVDVLGLIPAHAGKTRTCAPRLLRCQAHPRSRGENHAAASVRDVRVGSSPLTRGKHGQA